VGRDYDDVPPTRGIFKGKAETKLEVNVQVTATEMPSQSRVWFRSAGGCRIPTNIKPQQQQQQQQ